MTILGTCRHLLQYLSLSPTESSEPQAEKGVDDSDGPGAGGGYEDSVEIEDPGDADGPGAGGGYDSLETEDPSDGPGAGGGYDDLGDDDGPGAGGGYDSLTDSDGPGAGGGYEERFAGTSAHYRGEEWFFGSKPRKAPANSNKTPVKGKAK